MSAAVCVAVNVVVVLGLRLVVSGDAGVVCC